MNQVKNLVILEILADFGQIPNGFRSHRFHRMLKFAHFSKSRSVARNIGSLASIFFIVKACTLAEHREVAVRLRFAGKLFWTCADCPISLRRNYILRT